MYVQKSPGTRDAQGSVNQGPLNGGVSRGGGGGGDFPIRPFPLSRPIKSTYKEQSRKGLRHNLDLSRKKWETPPVLEPPRFSFSQVNRDCQTVVRDCWLSRGLIEVKKRLKAINLRYRIEVNMGCGNLLSRANSNHRLETTIYRPSECVFVRLDGKKIRTRRIGANPEKSGLVNFRGPD